MTHDVIVVGGSYAGLSAAMQLARARKRVLVIDAGAPRNRFAHEGHGFFGQDGRPPFASVRENTTSDELLAYGFVEDPVSLVSTTAEDVLPMEDGYGQLPAPGRIPPKT